MGTAVQLLRVPQVTRKLTQLDAIQPVGCHSGIYMRLRRIYTIYGTTAPSVAPVEHHSGPVPELKLTYSASFPHVVTLTNSAWWL